MVRDSLQKFGAGRSILLDKNGVIISGNKSTQGAVAAGMKDVVVVRTDGTQLVAVQRTDLDINDPKARELSIVDNRSTQVDLEWDAEVMKAINDQDSAMLTDLFRPDELAAMLAGVPQVVAPDEFGEVDENIETKFCCPKCGYRWSGKTE